MIRTLIFMGLMAMSMLISSCCIMCCGARGPVQPLVQTVRETLKLVKKEAGSTIILTTKKVKCNEVDPDIGKEIIKILHEGERKIDTQLAVAQQLSVNGTKEEIMQFAERTDVIVQRALTVLKSLNDLYDISTYSQFETTTFFPADSFNIPPERIDEAKKAIEPVAQRIVRFICDHPRQKFEAVIACSSIPDGQDLNDKLSKLRARSVANLLAAQIRSKNEFIPNPEGIRYNIKWVGQRETLPSTGQARSMVSIIWNLLPPALYAGSAEH